MFNTANSIDISFHFAMRHRIIPFFIVYIMARQRGGGGGGATRILWAYGQPDFSWELLRPGKGL